MLKYMLRSHVQDHFTFVYIEKRCVHPHTQLSMLFSDDSLLSSSVIGIKMEIELILSYHITYGEVYIVNSRGPIVEPNPVVRQEVMFLLCWSQCR